MMDNWIYVNILLMNVNKRYGTQKLKYPNINVIYINNI